MNMPPVNLTGHPRQMTLSKLIDRDIKSMVDGRMTVDSSLKDHSLNEIKRGIEDSLNELYQKLKSKVQQIPLKISSKQSVLPINPYQIAISSQGHLIVSRDLKMVKTDKSLMDQTQRERCGISKLINNAGGKLRKKIAVEEQTRTTIKTSGYNHKNDGYYVRKPDDVLRKTVNHIGQKVRPTKYLNAGKYEQIRVWLIQSLNDVNEAHSSKEVVELSHKKPSVKVFDEGIKVKEEVRQNFADIKGNGKISIKFEENKMSPLQSSKHNLIRKEKSQLITRKRKLRQIENVEVEIVKKLAKLDDLPFASKQENIDDNIYDDDDVDFKIESSVVVNYIQ